MRSSARESTPFIPNDELEHHRIQLEHNLRNSETAIHLSASESDVEPYYSGDDLESLEYPRHNSAPTSHHDFSFDHRTRDYLADEDPQGHGWSYCSYEEGVNPFAGETMSTAAHHASAVTLSAGLGGRGVKRDMSLSGVEYDPDRPLNDIIAGADSKLSVFGTEVSRSRHLTLTSDPLVVEDTAELDQILETGYTQASMRSRSVRVASPVTSGSSSHSESERGYPISTNNATPKSRPKLTDALRSVSLSPKRPRSPQVSFSSPLYPPQKTTSSLSRTSQRSSSSSHVPTPRPQRRNTIFPSNAPSPQQPDVRLQPPTPSSTGSKFTRMARGLAKEIEDERGQLKTLKSSMKKAEQLPSGSALPEANPFQDTNWKADSAHALRSIARNKSRIQLPDVTGLTNAIESPAKLGIDYYTYPPNGRITDVESRILQTLNAVQQKLQRLEEENGISRRRVRELEMELEDCKKEVARERTHLIEQGELLRQQQPGPGAGKGKGRARDVSINTSQRHERYKEAVEEKKALETLIVSLRAHLARLTSELSSHHQLLVELRTLRETDSTALREKGAEITRLKNEVERLAGEVEVLRGVVEEGLRERRATKDASLEGFLTSGGGNETEERHESDSEEEEEDPETETEDVEFPTGSGASRPGLADKTMRTDHATQGSSHNNDTQGTRFMDVAELERISAEIDERRSDQSGSINLSQLSRSHSPAQSPVPGAPKWDHSFLASQPNSPGIVSNQEVPEVQRRPRAGLPEVETMTRPAVVDNYEPHPSRCRGDDAPFPKIRGKRLERLFFSAPEHDAQTCTTCNRDRCDIDGRSSRRPRGAPGGTKLPRHTEDVIVNGQDDEGFADGSDGLDRAYPAQSRDKGKRRERSLENINEVTSIARQEGLPPQTIVARIIRELEDDFTHYKSIYIELADQYKEMDAASNVAKRNTLARHLREVVDILEQKGDQIASLYEHLSFKNI